MARCVVRIRERFERLVQLTTSYTATMLKGSQEQSEKEEKLLKLLLPSGESNLTN